MPNPSTLALVEEDKRSRYETTLRYTYDTRLSKGTREANLREARQLAEELGIEQPGPINGLTAEEALQRAPSGSQRHVKQTPTTSFMPFDGREYLLTKGQRLILIDALTGLTRAMKTEPDPELAEERRLLIELLHQ